MRTKWIATGGIVFCVSSSLWASYLISQRAFLRELNAGVHAYLSGHYDEAETHLNDARTRRPHNAEVSQMLLKVLVEESFSQYHQKDFDAALRSLSRAFDISSIDGATRESLENLKRRMTESQADQPVVIKEYLQKLYAGMPEADRPSSPDVLVQNAIRNSSERQEQMLKRFWESQERWLNRLEKEKNDFERMFIGGLVAFGLTGILLAIGFVGVMQRYFGRRGVVAGLLENHFQRVLAALPPGSGVLLGPPPTFALAPEGKRIDAIEAELVTRADPKEACRALKSFLKGEDPWVRARAAKVLYTLDRSAAIEELRNLISDASNRATVPGVWALSELATSETIDLMRPLAFSANSEVQQAVIRSLVQLQARTELDDDVKKQLPLLLSEIRSKTGWII